MKKLISLMAFFATAGLFGLGNNLSNQNVSRIAIASTATGPTLIASDDFSSYTMGQDIDSAAQWVKVLGLVEATGTSSVWSFDASAETYYYNTASPNANQRVEFTVVSMDDVGYTGAFLRGATDNSAAYIISVKGDGLMRAEAYMASGYQELNVTSTGAISPGDKIAFEVTGTGSAIRLNVQTDTGSGWTNLWTNMDPDADVEIDAAGKSGIQGFQNGSEVLITDWKLYNL